MAGRIGGDGDDEPIAEINVVPLVDIILVVLIIFMVTAPLVLKPTIDINLPKSSSGDTSAPSPLNIAVGKDGAITLNGQPTNLQDIIAFISRTVAVTPDAAVILQADRAVTLEQLTEVIDVVKSAGVKRVAFSIEKKIDKR
jgi:biopolymer transport protein ExbD